MKEPENLSREDQTVVLFEFGGNGEAAAAFVRSLRGRSNSSIADKLTFQDGLRMEKEATTPEYKTGRRRTKKDLTCPREKLYQGLVGSDGRGLEAGLGSFVVRFPDVKVFFSAE